MRRVVIVQARMTSTRLPGKVLADLAGRPMLAQQIRRIRECRRADDIVIATTTRDSDDAVVELARSEGVRWYRGDEQDVLARYVFAAREARADLVARVTADCPLLDPAETDRVIGELQEHAGQADYASNVIERTFPRGLDAEALFRDVLERVGRMASSAKAREHVTWYVNRERPELFVRRSVRDASSNADLRWTVDAPEDLDVVRRIYLGLGLGEVVRPYPEVLAYVRARPNLAAANRAVTQKDA
jgi:spore coat polysaccharide biosynthesis protein SpsF